MSNAPLVSGTITQDRRDPSIPSTVYHDETGFSGPDYVPNPAAKVATVPYKPRVRDVARPEILALDRDYVPETESAEIRKLMDRQIDGLAKKIMDDAKDGIAKFSKAKKELSRLEAIAVPTEADLKHIDSLRKTVMAGPPMTLERAQTLARDNYRIQNKRG